MSAPEFSARTPLDRRTAIKWMLTAATASALVYPSGIAAEGTVSSGKQAKGYGTDPDLMKNYRPGDLWPLSFSEAQRLTAAALCDVIIPADSGGPSASSVNVPDFIDEWISAPYPGHDADRRVILDGLVWFDAEAQRRFGKTFVGLESDQKHAICDELCHVPDAKAEFRSAAQFFRRFRDLTAGGYYTTPAGMKDIGYVGNVPLASFDGPPPEVLKKLGLT
ncbi:MAG: hypothetical protein RIQ93_3531 [Verrucomicrobiota bacterium]|jgi:hypothetical protein